MQLLWTRNLGIALFGSGSGFLMRLQSSDRLIGAWAWASKVSHEPSKLVLRLAGGGGVFGPRHKDMSVVLLEYLLTRQLTSTRADSPGDGQPRPCCLLWLSLGSQMPSVLEHPVCYMGQSCSCRGLHRDTQERRSLGATLETSSKLVCTT